MHAARIATATITSTAMMMTTVVPPEDWDGVAPPPVTSPPPWVGEGASVGGSLQKKHSCLHDS